MPNDDIPELEFNQGDIVDAAGLRFWQDEEWPDGAAIVSQTCDVRHTKVASVILGKVVTLDREQNREAFTGESSRFASLDDDGRFIDLDTLQSVPKTTLSARTVTVGFPAKDSQRVSSLGSAIGRRFARFPLPDEVVPWLRPLRDVVMKKYRKDSALGRVLRDAIYDIRISADQWAQPGRDLTIHLVLEPGVVPTTADVPVASDDLAAWLSANPDRSPGMIAERMEEAFGDDLARLWGEFADSLATACQTKARLGSQFEHAAVDEVVTELWSVDEFPYQAFRKSESLDYEFLSGGEPPETA